MPKADPLGCFRQERVEVNHEGESLQSLSQKYNLILQIFQLAIEHSLIGLALGVSHLATIFARFELQTFDRGDGLSFGACQGIHLGSSEFLRKHILPHP